MVSTGTKAWAGFGKEEGLLLTCIREAIKGRRLTPDEHGKFLNNVDWQRLQDLAFENRVASLLHFSLGRMNIVPEKQKRILREFYLQTAQRNLLIRGKLQEILRGFRKRGIEVILLKGVALAYGVWKNMALRQMHDVDLLLHGEDIGQADQFLKDLGFSSKPRIRSLDWYFEREKNLPYYSLPGDDVNIELHYSCFVRNPVFELDIEEFWNRSELTDFYGEPARIFSVEDLISHLCLHVSFDHFLGDNMRSLIDIAMVTRQNQDSLNWEELERFAVENRLERLVYFPLRLAREYLDAKVSPVFDEEIKERTGLSLLQRRFLSKVARDFLFTADEAEFGQVSAIKKALRRMARELLWRRGVNLLTAATYLLVPQREFTTDPPSPLGYVSKALGRSFRLLKNALFKK